MRKTQRQQMVPGNRRGFTLIELLVTISIFIILLAITASAFNVGQDREKITGAARQIQSAVEGARSRAFKLQRPIGLRFNIDPSDPTVSPSMIYVQQLEPITGTLDVGGPSLTPTDTPDEYGFSEIQIRTVDQLPDAPNGDVAPKDGYYDTTFAHGDLNVLVNAVKQGLITPGVTIRIRGGSTDYGEYTIISHPVRFCYPSSTPIDMAVDDVFNPGDGRFFIFPRFRSPGSPKTTVDYTNTRGKVIQSLDFEIIPAAIPLQNEEPLVFPQGVVIDWDSSRYPREWSKITSAQIWEPSVKYSVGQWLRSGNYYLKCVDFGTSSASGTGPVATNENEIIQDGTVYWRSYNSPQLDLMFSPRGSAIGSVSTNGLIHFGLAYRRDTDIQTVDTTKKIALNSVFDVRKQPDGKYFFKGEHRICTLFLQSGAVITNEPDFTDVIINATGVSGSDEIADNPFQSALDGGESK
ncbi:pilus assembly FimT family protein [Lacunimicrobium album]